MKLLILGNAHIACIRAAWRRNLPPGLDAVFFAAPGDRLSCLEARGASLVSQDSAVNNSLRVTGGKAQISPGDFDYVVVCGLSPPPADYLAQSSAGIHSSIGSSADDGSSDSSAGGLEQCPLKNSTARKLLDQIRQISSVPVGFAGRPAPVLDRYEAADASVVTAVIADRHAALGVDWIAQAPDTQWGAWSTQPRFVRQSPRLHSDDFFNDRIHMNEPFGDAWGRQILIAACAATGQRPPEPQTKSVEAATSEPGKPWLTEAPRYSQGFEELLIREYFADQKGGYFVDVGAGPALAGSNTAFLERHLGWQGIGVDALGHYEDNYLEQRPRTRFINFVVAESSSPAHPFFHVVAAEGLSSTDEARMFEGKPLNSKRVEVPAATLDEILDAAQLTHIDFMSIDVEASNLSCLKGLNLRKHRPRLVCMETGDPTSQQRRDIIEHFQAAGFVLVPEFRPYTAPNTWFHPRPAPLIPNSSKPGSANTSGA